MCYNNPVVYGVDIAPEMFAELADEPTVVAIKESSDDPRRLTDIVNACGERYILFGGVDDLVMESVLLGAVRSEEHTSELQSLMRNSYAVFCLNKKTYTIPSNTV